MHACMHIHTYLQIYKHTYIQTYIHACMNTSIHTYIHTYVHTNMHTYKHTYPSIRTDIYACTYTYTSVLLIIDCDSNTLWLWIHSVLEYTSTLNTQTVTLNTVTSNTQTLNACMHVCIHMMNFEGLSTDISGLCSSLLLFSLLQGRTVNIGTCMLMNVVLRCCKGGLFVYLQICIYIGTYTRVLGFMSWYLWFVFEGFCATLLIQKHSCKDVSRQGWGFRVYGLGFRF